MTEQLSLCAPTATERRWVPAHEITPPRARRTDPDTSSEAAENARSLAKTHRGLVLRALRICPNPLTYRELTREIGRRWTAEAHKCGLWGEHVKVMRRLGDLKRDGVAEHGKARFCTVAGSRMVTWVLVD